MIRAIVKKIYVKVYFPQNFCAGTAMSVTSLIYFLLCFTIQCLLKKVLKGLIYANFISNGTKIAIE